MATPPKCPVFCAIDTPDVDLAGRLARAAAGAGMGIKLGKEFFAAHGPEGVRRVLPAATPLFLDLKFHDIPNTVAGAVRAAAASVRPFLLTVHAAGGVAMLRAAADAAARSPSRPLIAAVTVLTSLDAEDLKATGIAGPLTEQVRRLAALAVASGCGALVSAAAEIVTLRETFGPQVKLVVPGIRPAGSIADDQKRVMTPAEALRLGADYLVIGRPITGAADPAAAAQAIAVELAAAAG